MNKQDERLEFLGDKVLGLTMTEWLFELFPSASEADLARRYHHLVSREVLAQVAMNGMLRPARDKLEQQTPRLLANMVEVEIAREYREHGLAAAAKMVKALWRSQWRKSTATAPVDAKTRLQEAAQAMTATVRPQYAITNVEGPEHAPTFEVVVSVGSYRAKGYGPSIKAAEQKAAEALLPHITKTR